jgi:hypothetical protein
VPSQTPFGLLTSDSAHSKPRFASPKAEIIRQPNRRNSIRPARTHRETSGGAQLRLYCASKRSQHRRALPNAFYSPLLRSFPCIHIHRSKYHVVRIAD